MPACQAVTKKRIPCTLMSEIVDDKGEWKCHVHHPNLTFRRQVSAKHQDSAERQKSVGEGQALARELTRKRRQAKAKRRHG